MASFALLFFFFVVEDGMAFTWGWNEHGSCGDGKEPHDGWMPTHPILPSFALGESNQSKALCASAGYGHVFLRTS
jgi:alpha-tubulin suppressor-like RCC1 family protein